MRFLISLAFSILFSNVSQAQSTFKIWGQVKDTSQQLALENATIVLSRTSDSLIVQSQRAGKDGRFEIKDLPQGDYFLLITYPRYADYGDIIKLDATRDLGLLNMITKAFALETVIVRASPVRMKGDTLSFLADSFKVREGDNVEELLKRLPGLRVNSKGEITAQGQQVRKVLVDGDEFFGDDPTLATRNIRADMVKEVQVFDKKSDQATFTGVDDGETEKTINLKLKDEAKNGYFGKIAAGGGLKDNYKNEVMANLFKGKRKVSAYGLMSNVDRAGLDWGDNRNYGGNMGNTTEMTDDGGIMMMSQGDEFDYGGNTRNEGLPRALTGGVSFSDKWKENKNSFTGSYRYRDITATGGSRTTSQFILPDTQYFNNERTNSEASRVQHRFNANYDFQIDSSQSILVKVAGALGTNQAENIFESEALAPNGNLVNSSRRRTTNDENSSSVNGSLLWRKKFEKRGRTLSANFTYGYNKSKGEGFLQNFNTFFKAATISGRDTTDQLKTDLALGNSFSTRIAVTEGIGKKGIIEWNYQYNRQTNESERLSFDKINNQFDQLNERFSNQFNFLSNTHNTGIGYKYSERKWNAGLGGNIAISDWKQDDLLRDTSRNIQFTNFLGRGNVLYKVKPQTNLSFNYNARTQNPNINQLQPIEDNLNPLFILVGNSDLKLSFNQDFSLSFNEYKVLSSRSIYASINFNTVSNAFSQSEVVDSVGRRISQTINVDGNYGLSGYLYYSKQIGQSEFNFNSNGSFRNNRFINLVNGFENATTNNNFSGSIGLSRYSDKKLSFNIDFEAAYNTSKSSIRKDEITRFWTMSPNGRISLELMKNLRFESSVNYEWREQTSVFDQNNNVILWNAEITKKILKKKDLRLGFKVNDILNQNLGFNRQITSNFVTEQSWQIVRRYWLATLVWNFSKNGKPSDW